MSVDHNSRVRIHPAALATIIDAHERRGTNLDGNTFNYIIGTLMGTCDGTLVTIDQSFTIKHRFDEDNNDSLEVDKVNQKEMLSLIELSSPEHVVVGWFSTANDTSFDEIDKCLLEYYSNDAQGARGLSNAYTNYIGRKKALIKPIFLRVNIEYLREKAKHPILPINAYLPEAFNITQNGDKNNYDVIWTELQIEIGCGSAERSALNLMLKTSEPSQEKREQPCLKIDAVGSNLDPLNNLCLELANHIEKVQSFVQRCIIEEDMDEVTGRMLAEIFNGVPGLDKYTMDKMLNGELTDLLMVTYLSQLANVQIALNDKLKQAYAYSPKTAEAKLIKR